MRTLGQSGEGAAPGDAKKGLALLRGKGRCLQCHVLDGDGGHLGPSLTDIGQRRSPAYLRTKLMNPGADPLSNSTLVKLTTQDGRQVTGMWMNEDTWSIQIRDDRLGLHSYWKQDLKELSVEHRALMPSYAKQFSDQELGDIVAFLRRPEGGLETRTGVRIRSAVWAQVTHERILKADSGAGQLADLFGKLFGTQLLGARSDQRAAMSRSCGRFGRIR